MKYLLIGVNDQHFDKLAGNLLWTMSTHLEGVHTNQVQIQGTRDDIVRFLSDGQPAERANEERT
jgi:hypothetical protein